MLPIHKKIINEELKELKKNPHVVSILLYGSLARGTANKYSDVDIEIIYNGKYKDTHHFRHGIKVDNEYWPKEKLKVRIQKYPYLSYPYIEEKILYDPTGFAGNMIAKLKKYFRSHPIAAREWKIWTRNYLEFKKNGIKSTNKQNIASCQQFYDRLEIKFSKTHKITRDF